MLAPFTSTEHERMARPVRKGDFHLALVSLLQRIRSQGFPRPRWRSAQPDPHNHSGLRVGPFNLKTAVGVGWSADCLAFSTSGCGSAGREAWGRTQRAALKENLEGSREDLPPALQARQLLRSFCEFA